MTDDKAVRHVGKQEVALLKQLPQIEELLEHPHMRTLVNIIPQKQRADAARDVVDEVRRGIISGSVAEVNTEEIALEASRRALSLLRPSLRRVVNTTGIVIHTNLGRSVLSPSAVQAVHEVASGYSTLEYDTETMSRGSRHAHCERLLCTLTGAEAAIAVNNNAAAVMMVLSEFASGKEAIISRGELVEIGGSFRIPDIMDFSGTRIVEVGTTNKTHEEDYARAMTPETAMLLKVHPSNYRMVGFTESVAISDLRKLADEEAIRRGDGSRVLVYEDQGSGVLVDIPGLGDALETPVATSLKAGCDLVSFSGDKLLGGPQAGIIVGSKGLIDRLKSNPLARVLRLDKMTLAALEATLRLYLDPEEAISEIPTLRMLTEGADRVRARAEKMKKLLEDSLPGDCIVADVVPETSYAGGGSLPERAIDTFAVRITFKKGDAQSCGSFLANRRTVPIITRIKQDAILCDMRTVLSKDEADEIVAGFSEYFQEIEG